MNAAMKKGLAALLGLCVVAGCEAMSPGKPSLDGELDVIEATDQTEIMLTLAQPGEAVNYFRRKLATDPDNETYIRGLAISLERDSKPQEAALAYDRLIAAGYAKTADRISYAETLIKTGDIESAEKQLAAIPPTVESYKRYLLEAIVADNNKDWERADSFYETARGLTAKPAPVLNNWGMSNLARGNFDVAANKFQEAITFDPGLFQAKNNLITARGQQRLYKLPVIPMSEIEEAQLLYNLGIIASRNSDIDVARGLFELAIDTHPQYFAEAVDNLAALEGNVGR